MKVTKDLAELCSLLIDEVYGELPSRIFSVLLNRGRSSIGQLGQYTSMTPRQLRHGLAVLIQQNLLYYHVDNDTKMAVYEASPEPAYNLIRTGKILEMVESAYGPAVKDVMQSLLLLGQTRVLDLKAAYEDKMKQSADAAQLANSDFDMNQDSQAPKKPTLPVKSVAHLNSIICRLAEAELVDVVHNLTFTSPEDIQKDVEERVTRVKFPGGVKGGKGKMEFDEAVAMELCKIRRESKTLKRKLEESGASIAKRRKLINGGGVNGVNGVNGDHDVDADPVLDPRQVIRVNYEKCLVELRNRRLVQFASEMIGDTTSYVYAVVLRQLTKKVSRCRTDPIMDIGDMGDEDGTRQPIVDTMEILDNLPTTIDPSNGLAKVSRSRINKLSAEAVNPDAPNPHKIPFLDGGDDNDDNEDDDDESDMEMNGNHESEGESDKDTKPGVNGVAAKVRFAEPPRKEGRLDMLRQHLYLLAENKVPFIRQCAPGKWAVDFRFLVQHLREAELDTVIERTVGRQGLRLVRILRKKGKLDEKALPNISLMKKSDVQNKMLEMEVAGFVDIQEVPRDNSRTANRTIFLWYTDTERCIHTLLNNTYKTAIRCLQRLSVHRRKEKDVLLLTKRTDVKGREKDMMQKEYYDRFAKLLEIERKLLGHMMRMDEMVAVLRDY
ncbi:RNA polymerase III subunit RPC82-domain-containing protein [Coniochaeta sp. 2T2.1]|nr:RNA polymerase III subunit RPC82-domain-containing protein [Coniochaeta sp. 2T2.1]